VPLDEEGSPRTRASKRRTLLKRLYFATIGSYSVKTLADRYKLLHIITSNSDGLF